MPPNDPDEALELPQAAAIIAGSGRPVLQALWPLMLIWGLACLIIGATLVAFGTERTSGVVMAVVLITGSVVSSVFIQLTAWGIHSPTLGRMRLILAIAVGVLGAIGLATAIVPAPSLAGVPTVWASSIAALAVGTAWGLLTAWISHNRLHAQVSIVWVVFFAVFVAAGLPIAAYVLTIAGLATVIATIPTRAAEIRYLRAAGSLTKMG